MKKVSSFRNGVATSLIFFATGVYFAGCSSTNEYKTQQYAKLSNSKDFEFDYERVWRGAKQALGEYRVEKEDLEKGLIQTDWVYSTSSDKYVEFQVNGFPRKKYLQTRFRFDIELQKHFGKVTVLVEQEEEIEKLRSDGSFSSWRSVSEPDSARAADLLKNIELKILGDSK